MSDGSELIAKDFEYSWKRAADPKTAADYSYDITESLQMKTDLLM